LTGLTAINETVNVTIQLSVVPLRSVNGWLTIMSRIDGSFPTGQTFSAYQGEFGDILSNFWLGLERIHQLTNPSANGGRNCRMRLELQRANDNTHVIGMNQYISLHDCFMVISNNPFALRKTVPGYLTKCVLMYLQIMSQSAYYYFLHE